MLLELEHSDDARCGGGDRGSGAGIAAAIAAVWHPASGARPDGQARRSGIANQLTCNAYTAESGPHKTLARFSL